MDNTLKFTPKKKKKNLLALAGGIFGTLVITIGLSFYSKIAHSAAPDANFRIIMPSPDPAVNSRGANVYMEISQPGNHNSLDVPNAWAKIYLDGDRLDHAFLGIYAGGYENNPKGADSEGDKTNGIGGPFVKNLNGYNSDTASKFEFFYGEEGQFNGYPDEKHCNTPFATFYNHDLSSSGWSQIPAGFFKGGKCGANGPKWAATKKSGKYVVFVKASWTGPNPLQDGRLNAFKIGAAYDNSAGFFDSPITGFWADNEASIASDQPQTAAYALQDRYGSTGQHGDYQFKFAPNCSVPVGHNETRYLHWFDVDYPDYYVPNGENPPWFELWEIAPNGTRTSLFKVTKDSRLPNGDPVFGNGRHGYIPFTGKGGYKYEWDWHDVTRIDGVAFWLPYDDYPAYFGCGSWEQGLNMKAGTTTIPGVSTQNYTAASGQTLRVDLTALWNKGTAAGPQSQADLWMTGQNNARIDASLDPSNIRSEQNGFIAGLTTTAVHIHWDGLKQIGPPGIYGSTNDFNTYIPLKQNAPDGARYCFTSQFAPQSNTHAGPVASNPNQICVTIDNSLKPYLTTNGADVHAGGGPCTLRQSTGKIRGIQDGSVGSSGSYIVSANGDIRDFGSGGSVGNNSLTMGRYGPICRPTPQQIFDELTTEKVVNHNLVDSQHVTYVNLSLFPPGAGKRYVFEADGDITVQGTAQVPVTIYAPNGTATINGTSFGSDQTYQAAPSLLPVVAVVAKDIKISKDVQGTKDAPGLKAILYAINKIDTCGEATGTFRDNPGNINLCKNPLFMSGFAMANAFDFKRTRGGQNLVGPYLGERIDFNAAFYISPPPGLGSVTGTVQYLGERAPLY